VLSTDKENLSALEDLWFVMTMMLAQPILAMKLLDACSLLSTLIIALNVKLIPIALHGEYLTNYPTFAEKLTAIPKDIADLALLKINPNARLNSNVLTVQLSPNAIKLRARLEQMESQFALILKSNAMMAIHALKTTVTLTLETVFTTKSTQKNAAIARLTKIVPHGPSPKILQILAKNLSAITTTAESESQKMQLNAKPQFALTVFLPSVLLLNAYSEMITNQFASLPKNLVMMETNALLTNAIFPLETVSTLSSKLVNANLAEPLKIAPNGEFLKILIPHAKFLYATLSSDIAILKQQLTLPSALSLNALLMLIAMTMQSKINWQINVSKHFAIPMQQNAHPRQSMT
jgi:hypothetical protein